MECSGDADRSLYGNHPSGSDLRQEYRLWNHGDRRDDKRNRLCHADHDVSYDGNLRICYDHDAEASTDRITSVLTEVPEMQEKEQAVKEVSDGGITFEHVDFSYAGEGGPLSLKDVNLSIKPGQTVGIIGGTGSSKSTLVQLIPRLYDVTKGSVKVGGIDVREYDLEVLRDQVSMVLQKNVLFTGSIYENIRWGNEKASNEEVERVCRLAQADGFVKEFPHGYDTMIVQGGNNVSGGQQQRTVYCESAVKAA